jgi:hypothetical protein
MSQERDGDWKEKERRKTQPVISFFQDFTLQWDKAGSILIPVT